MIKLENLTPPIYYTQSRDFQFIGRLFDIVLNSTRTNVQIIQNLLDIRNIDDKLLNLLALTLGFKANRNYNSMQLRAVCGSLSDIIRNKGNIRSVRYLCNAILTASDIKDSIDHSLKDGLLTIYIPLTLTDTSLLEDLLPYLIPAGISVSIIKELKEVIPVTTTIEVGSDVIIYGDRLETGAHNYARNLSGLINLNNLGSSSIRDIPGMLANSTIYKNVSYTYPTEAGRVPLTTSTNTNSNTAKNSEETSNTIESTGD